MEILYVLLVLLIATRALGELAVRPGQPSLVKLLYRDDETAVRAGAAQKT